MTQNEQKRKSVDEEEMTKKKVEMRRSLERKPCVRVIGSLQLLSSDHMHVVELRTVIVVLGGTSEGRCDEREGRGEEGKKREEERTKRREKERQARFRINHERELR